MRRLKEKRNPVGYAWKVTRHDVPSGALLEFKSDHPIWTKLRDGELPANLFDPDLMVAGCIAKITPPAGVSEACVYMVQTVLITNGARAVRCMPAVPDDRVHVKAMDREHDLRSLRQVAIDRAKRSSVANVDALVALINEAMDRGEV